MRVQPRRAAAVRRIAAIAGAVLLVPLIAALTFAVVDRRALVHDGIAMLLHRQGIAARFVVAEVGFRTLRLEHLRIGTGGAIAAQGVTVGYVPLALATGRVRSVAIDGLRASVEVGPGGVRLVGVPAAEGGGGGAAPLAIGRTTLHDARIEILAPTGEAELRADGTYAPQGGRLALALDAPNGERRITATLVTSGASGRPRVTLDAHADLPPESVVWGIADAPPPVGGVKARLAVTGALPRAPVAFAARPSFDGVALDFDAALDAPGALDGMAGLHLEGKGHLAGTAVRIAGTAALAVRIHRLNRGGIDADDLAVTAPVAFDAATSGARARLTAPATLTAAGVSSGSTAIPLRSATLTDGSVALAGGKVEGTAVIRASLGKTAWSGPLDLAGSVRLAKGAVTIAADANGAKGVKLAQLAGTATPDGRRADLTVRAGPFAFAPGALQPVALSPLLDGFTDVRGGLAATLRLRRADGKTESGGNVMLDGLSFRLGGIAVSGANAALNLASLAPVSTPPGQLLTADRVALVASLDGLRARFRLAPGPRLDLASATAGFAGGTIALGPVALGAGGAPPGLTVSVRDVKIAPLLKLLDVAGLSGTGTLNGTIPIGVARGNVTIDNGRLAAEGKGVIRFRSEQAAKALAAGGQSAQLLVQALEDFHYDSLAITLDKTASGEAKALIHLAGANPAVMNGQPFAFNINVTSDVDKLIGALMQGYRLATGMVTRAARGAAHAR